MSEEIWNAVDHYLNALLVPPDDALAGTLAASEAGGLPAIQVSPTFGKFLHLLALASGAKRILEIGTLGGYSTIWLARALPPEGRVLSLEFEPKHAAVARENLERAGLSAQVEVLVGDARDSLRQMAAEQTAPFDFIFIDADKDNYPAYFEGALRLARRGTVIVADNVVRQGGVIDPDHPDARVQGVRRFYELVAAEPRVRATALQTVGDKGHDGFCLAVVVSD